MGETILGYLLENWTVIAILIVVCYATAKIVRMATKWEDANEQRHKDAERRQNDVENSLKDILRRIAKIERYLIKNGDMDEYNQFTQVNSPRQLNEKGRRLYEESGAASFLNEKRDALLRLLSSQMDKMKVKTALDVEIISQQVCFEVSKNEDFKPIKDYIYTHPVFEGTNISIDTIAMLMGLELRNEYLKVHPEIDPMN